MHTTALLTLITSLILTLFTLPTTSLSILVPLYVYPEDNSWTSLINTITANPAVHFQIIVNPNSGPGSTTYPDSSYTAGVARLNALKNVNLIGYIPTGYSTRSYSAVTKEVDTYAGWRAYTGGANISLSGIFFDEVTDATSGSLKQFIANASAYASTQFSYAGTSKSVVLNPGCVVDSSYFSFADTIVEFEDSLAMWKGLKSMSSFPKPYMGRSTVILYSTGGMMAARIQTLIGKVKSAGVGSVWLSSDCCYNSVNATLLNKVVAAIAGS